MSTTTTTTYRTGEGETVHVKSRMLNVFDRVEAGATIKDAGESQGYKGGAASAAVDRVRKLIDADATIIVEDDPDHPFEGGNGGEGGATTAKVLDRMEYAASINPAAPHILSMLDGRRADADKLNEKATKLEAEAKAMRERATAAFEQVVGDLGAVLESVGIPDLAAFEADYARERDALAASLVAPEGAPPEGDDADEK
jgi:hypothetical protein